MASNNSPDYKALFLEAERKRKEAEESQRRLEEQNRPTTFGELIRYGHNIVARSLRVANQSRCTSGKISAPIGKKCPVQLRPWTECQAQQEDIYRSVCEYFESAQVTELFPSVNELEYEGRKVKKRPISSEQDLEGYERSAVEDHVRDIITELCKIDDARKEFHLGDGIPTSLPLPGWQADLYCPIDHNRLLEVPGWLLSINTLTQDTLYLKQSVRAFQNLLPKQFKGTINELQGPGIIIKASTMFNSFKRFHFALERERRWNWRTCWMIRSYKGTEWRFWKSKRVDLQN